MAKTLRQLAAGDPVTWTGEEGTRVMTVTRVRPTLIYCGAHKFDRDSGRGLDEPSFIVPVGLAVAPKPPPPAVGLAAAVKRHISAMSQEDFERLGEKRLRQLAELIGAAGAGSSKRRG